MAILVCGGAGYIGSHAVAELLEAGQEVVVVDNLQKGHKDALWEGKSEKTIRRDLDVIKEFFPNAFELIRGGKGETGCY